MYKPQYLIFTTLGLSSLFTVCHSRAFYCQAELFFDDASHRRKDWTNDQTRTNFCWRV